MDDLKVLSKITRKSRLTPKDITSIKGIINKEVFEELDKGKINRKTNSKKQ